jgi:FkbM family methyltransferase
MSAIKRFAKSCFISLFGGECRPRRILRGLPSGYKICVSPAENLAYLVGTAEPHLQKIIKEYVSLGDTVYDVGANIGYVSLALAKRVGPAGKVVAFEPLPQNVEKLRKSIDVNGLKNIQLFDLAAAEKDGEAIIRLAENPSTASLVWHKNDTSASQFVVRKAAIDDLVSARALSYPKFVKIDVEGAEASVLQGMRRTLSKSMPVVFVECSEIGRESTWDIFRGLQYRCQSAITRQWVNSFDEYRHSDFLWLPGNLETEAVC